MTRTALITGAAGGIGAAVAAQYVGVVALIRLETLGSASRSASFLSSENARFITGQTLVVDGGWTMS